MKLITKKLNLEKFDFQTGDIILFNEKKSIISRIIEYFTSSEFSHIAIVIKDPDFTPEKLKGIYLLESGSMDGKKDAEDGIVKTGVQLRKLEDVVSEYDGDVYLRKLECDRNENFYENIKKAHSILHNKPYDFNPFDWFKSLFNIHSGNEQRKDCFFCSALCSFVYVQLGFLKKDVPWSIIRPRDFSTEHKDNRIKFINCKISKEILIN